MNTYLLIASYVSSIVLAGERETLTSAFMDLVFVLGGSWERGMRESKRGGKSSHDINSVIKQSNRLGS